MPSVKGKHRKPRVRQARPKPRKPLRAKSSRSWRKIVGLIVFVAAAAAVGGTGGILVRWAYTSLTHSESFAIREIEVMGNRRVKRGEILRYSRVKKGHNIFTIDLDRAAHDVQTHPWIRGVTVKRNFPDKIVIHVVERVAMAIIRKEGLRLMGSEGEVFKALEPGDPTDMPVITGPGGSDAALDLNMANSILRVIDLARASGMMPDESISEIVVSASGLKLIGVDEPHYVEMGDKDIERRWLMLEIVLAEARRSGAEVIGVDLRYRDGAALKLKAAPKTLVADGRRVKEKEAD